MPRLLDNWITSYLELTKETEPPQRYHLWTAITIIGAMLGRKCEAKLGPETVFPNLYTILVGPPAARKGTAIKYGVEILNEVQRGTSGPEVVTKEQLVAEFELLQDTVTIEGNMFTHSSMFVIAPELINFIKENDYERLGYLCDLYDGRDKFDYKTKTSGTVFAVNPGLWILGATTPNWIEIAMKELGTGGGMTSRIVCVYAAKKEKHISITRLKPFNTILRSKLINDLAMIKQMAGRFVVTPDADNVFTEWYEGRYKTTCIDDGRFHSYWGRLPGMVVKVAMIISAAKREDMKVQSADIIHSIRMFDAIHPEMPLAFGALGHNVIGSQTEMVRELLREKGQMYRHEILHTLRMHLSAWDYMRVRNSLIAERFCTYTYDNNQGDEMLICRNSKELPESKTEE